MFSWLLVCVLLVVIKRVLKECFGLLGGKWDVNCKWCVHVIVCVVLMFFFECGVEVVMIDDIACEVEIAKGLFYCYFVDKLELVEVIFESMLVVVCGVL